MWVVWGCRDGSSVGGQVAGPKRHANGPLKGEDEGRGGARGRAHACDALQMDCPQPRWCRNARS